jgi:hypothetical protein
MLPPISRPLRSLAEQPATGPSKRLRLLRGIGRLAAPRAIAIPASPRRAIREPAGRSSDRLLADHFDAARLAESRRDLRTRGQEAAASTVAALLLDLQRFLEVRRERVEDPR